MRSVAAPSPRTSARPQDKASPNQPSPIPHSVAPPAESPNELEPLVLGKSLYTDSGRQIVLSRDRVIPVLLGGLARDALLGLGLSAVC